MAKLDQKLINAQEQPFYMQRLFLFRSRNETCEVPDLIGKPDAQVIAGQIAAGIFVAADFCLLR